MKIRVDEKGLYIKDRFSGTNHYRPGPAMGYDVVYNMSDGGLKPNDNPKTAHVAGAPLVKITLDDGTVLHWADDYTRNNN